MITTKSAKIAKGVSFSIFVFFVVFVVQVLTSIDIQAQDRSAELVQQLRDLPRPVASTGNSATLKAIEARRQQLYTEIARLGESGARALVDALRDPDTTMRQNVATALVHLSMNLYRQETKLDLTGQLPGLRAALRDPDDSVRSWVAQAIGPIGQAAAPAVPELLVLLASTEGSRNSALIALAGIGPAAKDALPAVRAALADPSPDVRGFAQRAIEKIDVQTPVR